MKIIIIDDEIAALNTFLAHIVDEFKLEYKMFQNEPASALEYAAREDVNAAFLDINMPKINGVDLAEKLVKVNKNIMIVFISGYAQDEDSISARLKGNLLGYCYKPYNPELLYRFLNLIREKCGAGRNVHIKTFGGFDLFIDGKPVKFSSSKSKELLALLVDKNGLQVNIGTAIANLWPEKNPENAKILYRDAVWRLRTVLEEHSLGGLVSFQRALLTVNRNGFACDYWQLLDGKETEGYAGEYMPQYDWSVETQNYLDKLAAKK